MTELCKSCAKAKNVCQTCVFDLTYGLPVQVRDSVLAEHERVNLPESAVGKNYMLEQMERKLADPSTADSALSQYTRPNAVLERLARTSPFYDRNRAKLCTFFARGACTRGATCPYRHEMPVQNEMSKQNIKDRYNGVNDPVANKILKRAAAGAVASAAGLQPPEDRTITTLFLGGVPLDAGESDIRAALTPFGPITFVKLLSEKMSAIVTFADRASAEEAVSRLHNCLRLCDVPIRVAWGKKKAPAAGSDGSGVGNGAGAASSGLLAPPPPPGMSTTDTTTGGSTVALGAVQYPSMNKDYVPMRSMNKPPPPPGM